MEGKGRGELIVEILYDHYKDSNVIASSYMSSRNRAFTVTLVTLGVMAIVGVNGGPIVNEVLKWALTFLSHQASTVQTQIGFVTINSLLWIVLVGSVLQYSRQAAHVVRSYVYVEQLEGVINRTLGFPAICREGAAYFTNCRVLKACKCVQREGGAIGSGTVVCGVMEWPKVVGDLAQVRHPKKRSVIGSRIGEQVRGEEDACAGRNGAEGGCENCTMSRSGRQVELIVVDVMFRYFFPILVMLFISWRLVLEWREPTLPWFAFVLDLGLALAVCVVMVIGGMVGGWGEEAVRRT